MALPKHQPLHVPSWRGDRIPSDEARREILNLYRIINELQKEIDRLKAAG